MEKRIAKAVSFLELIKRFPDNKSVVKFLEKLKWSKGVFCPRCNNRKGISKKATGDRFCNYCRKEFNIKTNTLMQNTKVPSNKWVYAVYLMVTGRKGISSLELSKKLDITQTTAWLLNHKIIEACKGELLNC